MSKKMRAKVRITKITRFGDTHETLFFNFPAKDGIYPADGSDEDQQFAKYSPDGSLQLTVANPDLLDVYKEGDTFYLDFVPI